MLFSNGLISIATKNDLQHIEKLLNKAYRGESARQGWTNEAHLIAGDTRTTFSELEELLKLPGSVFLKFTMKEQIIGCVNLQQHENKIYLGMLAVDPPIQGAGAGKQLLAAAEEYAIYRGCNSIYMSVISLRSELIAWYIRHGYLDTGERIPFYEDLISGRHLQPLEFLILEKEIS